LTNVPWGNVPWGGGSEVKGSCSFTEVSDLTHPLQSTSTRSIWVQNGNVLQSIIEPPRIYWLIVPLAELGLGTPHCDCMDGWGAGGVGPWAALVLSEKHIKTIKVMVRRWGDFPKLRSPPQQAPWALGPWEIDGNWRSPSPIDHTARSSMCSPPRFDLWGLPRRAVLGRLTRLAGL
jgi:hypothetical protein